MEGTPAGNAGLTGTAGPGLLPAVVGGGPGPIINQRWDLGQVTALPKPQFPHEMKLNSGPCFFWGH